jgi:hypothetical protein
MFSNVQVVIANIRPAIRLSISAGKVLHTTRCCHFLDILWGPPHGRHRNTFYLGRIPSCA